MDKWWSVSWKRVGATLLVVFVFLSLVAGLIKLVSYQLHPWIIARRFAHDFPVLNMVPVQLTDARLAPLTGVSVEFYGLSFQTPWKEIRNTRTLDGVSTVLFSNGAGIMIFDPAQDIEGRTFDSLRASHNLDLLAVDSHFALKAAEMYATSEQVKWWRTPSQNAKHLFPLLLKLSGLHDPNAIYPVSQGEFRGFQEGNPAVAPYAVTLDLFDGIDRHYAIELFGSKAGPPILTQSEINAMIASLRRVESK